MKVNQQRPYERLSSANRDAVARNLSLEVEFFQLMRQRLAGQVRGLSNRSPE